MDFLNSWERWLDLTGTKYPLSSLYDLSHAFSFCFVSYLFSEIDIVTCILLDLEINLFFEREKKGQI